MQAKYIKHVEPFGCDGGCTDPAKHLTIGETYDIETYKQESWRTRIWLVGMPDVMFNSVCFEITGSI